MKIVLDTNVLVSAVFFGGVPGRILSAWKAGRITLVVEIPGAGVQFGTDFPVLGEDRSRQ